MKQTIDEVLERMKLLEIDHTPDGWPAIQTKDVTAMRDEILRLRIELSSQRAGVRDVLTAAVNLVCAPGWAGVSDEDVILEAALRQAGYVQPNEVAS